jgi:hypothetical protein
MINAIPNEAISVTYIMEVALRNLDILSLYPEIFLKLDMR